MNNILISKERAIVKVRHQSSRNLLIFSQSVDKVRWVIMVLVMLNVYGDAGLVCHCQWLLSNMVFVFSRLRKLFAQKMEDGKEFNDLIILYCSSGRWVRLRLTQAWLQWGRWPRSTGDFSLSARSFSQKVDFVGWKFDADFVLFILKSTTCSGELEMDCNADFVAGKKQKRLQRHWVWLEKHGEFIFEIRAKY